jgi:two-component system response regulator DegU
MNNPIHIGIADDHLVLRQGLVSLLKEYDNLNIIIDVNNGKELLEALKKSKPDIVLLDIEMPVMNGKEALEKMQLKYPSIKVVIMSMHFNDAYIIEFIKKGACAFLPKNCDIEKIVDAIYSVHEFGHYYDNKVSAAMAAILKKTSVQEDFIPGTQFTKREIQIIRLICLKKTNLEIAQETNLSVRTIEGHRYNISKKTGINNTVDLVDFATRNKIISVS